MKHHTYLTQFKEELARAADALQRRENWVIASGIATHYADRHIHDAPLYAGDRIVDYDNDDVSMNAMLSMLLGLARGGSMRNVFGSHPARTGFFAGFANLARAFCLRTDELLALFVVTTDEHGIPRPLQTYRPDEFAKRQAEAVREAADQLRRACREIDERLSLDAVNEYAAHERMVGHWLRNAAVHFGDAPDAIDSRFTPGPAESCA